jgi:hypothetical protein
VPAAVAAGVSFVPAADRDAAIFHHMNLNRCKVCGRLALAGMVCLHAVAHPFDQPDHDHTRSPGESNPILGNVVVASSSTQRAVTRSFVSTALGTVTIHLLPPLPSK